NRDAGEGTHGLHEHGSSERADPDRQHPVSAPAHFGSLVGRYIAGYQSDIRQSTQQMISCRVVLRVSVHGP
ncbi:MAG: hypothetical protein LBE86_01645, partial [Gemmobacter sp.]|nr:hypothetical protein [Gemmobacter sp.]